MKKLFIFLLVTALLVSTFTLSVFAADTETYDYNGIVKPYPPIESSHYKQGYTYMILTQNTLYLCTAPVKVGIINDTAVFTPVYEGTLYRYAYQVQNGEWAFFSSGGTKYGDTMITANTALWSSFDIYNSDGSLFMKGDENFIPLHQQIQKVTEKTLAVETLPTVGGAMKILTACGVGLAALLMVLPLFGKLSKIFRLR